MDNIQSTDTPSGGKDLKQLELKFIVNCGTSRQWDFNTKKNKLSSNGKYEES